MNINKINMYALYKWHILLYTTNETDCESIKRDLRAEFRKGTMLHTVFTFLYSIFDLLILQDLEPLVDNLLRRKGAIIEGQILDLYTLCLELVRVVAGLADTHHSVNIVLFKLLRERDLIKLEWSLWQYYILTII